MSEPTKRCPYCSEEILAAARKCKHCGEWLEGGPPTSATGQFSDPETLVRTALSSRYEIEKELGRGGMAVVYRAVQENLGRKVALKVLPQGLTHDKKLLERFHREARSAAQLNHANIITIFDEGEISGVHFMSMEYLEGRDLHEIIQRDGPLPIDQAVSHIANVADALGYAHKRDTVHRDVKSSNVMVTNDGRAVLMDFGIAYASSEARLTQTGTVLGTPEYMSPEQARGHDVDSRGDIYSLGVVLYEILTGKLPFTGGHPMSVVYKVLHEGYKAPRAIRDDIPEWLEAIVARCLAKDADLRYQTGEEMGQALRTQEPGKRVPIPSVGDGSSAPDVVRLGDDGDDSGGGSPAATQVFRDGGDGVSSDAPAPSGGSSDVATKPSSSGGSGDGVATTSSDSGAGSSDSGAGSVQRQRLRAVRTLDGSADWVNAIDFSPDGQYAVSGGDGNSVKVWEVVTGREVQTFTGLSSQVISVAVSPDGKYMLSESSDGVVELWDVDSGQRTYPLEKHSEAVLAATFSPDGQYALSGSGDAGTLKLWETSSGRPVRTFESHQEAIFSVAFSPDGRYVLSGSGQSGTLNLWETANGRLVRTFEGDWHSTYVFSVAFSPDGTYALSGSDDMAARLWEVESGRLVRTFDGHSGLVIAVAFSPDGQYILSGSSDMTVQLWKVSDGTLGYVFEGDSDGVNAIAFSPDGRYVLSGSKDRHVKLWTP